MNKNRVVISSFLLALAGCAGGGGGGSSTPAALVVVPISPASVTSPAVSISATYSAASGLTSVATTDQNASLDTTGTVGRGTTGNVSSATLTSTNATAAGGSSLTLSSNPANTANSFTVSNAGNTASISGATSTFANVAAAIAGTASFTNYSYLTFGGWGDCGANCGLAGETGVIGYYVSGSETPSGAIPTSGSATYTGLLQGIYYSGSTLLGTIADVTLTADFTNRNLAFSTNNSITYVRGGTVGSTQASRSDLNMTGTLSYLSGSNTFTGAVTDATHTGTATGSFYGPVAQEVGGVFSVSGGGSSHTGSFVAK
ncbi:MAG: transferrin-binding protein-like solute binding protein [Pseudomonadota bacterium]